MKNFVNAMDREVSGFAFLSEKFPQISMEKLKTSIFDGVIFWVVGEKCVWLQNKERIDTHNNTVMML